MLFDWLARRQMAAFEDKFHYDMSYGRELLGWSGKAFWRFSRLAGLANYREGVPLSTWYAAKVVGARSEDCGPCVQLVVDMARSEGVADAVLRAVLEDKVAMMDADAALGYHYARAVVEHGGEVLALRDEVLRRFGPRGMASLVLALTASRMYPLFKYAMGHGHACVRVRVGSETVLPIVMNNPAHALRA